LGGIEARISVVVGLCVFVITLSIKPFWDEISCRGSAAMDSERFKFIESSQSKDSTGISFMEMLFQPSAKRTFVWGSPLCIMGLAMPPPESPVVWLRLFLGFS
jgi:hypothetical protein